MLELVGPIQSMCPSHKTENLESCGFLRSVYRYTCDFLAENLSFLSHLPLTQSPSLGKNELSSERLLDDNLMAVQSLKRHPGDVSSEAFQMFLKEKSPLNIWVLLLAFKPTKSISNGAPYSWTWISISYKSSPHYGPGLCVYLCYGERTYREELRIYLPPSYIHASILDYFSWPTVILTKFPNVSSPKNQL